MADWADELDTPDDRTPADAWKPRDLFNPEPLSMPLAPGVKGRDYGLRYYQEEARDGTYGVWRDARSALVVMATGMGKSRLVAAIVGDWAQGDVLVLVHTDELVRQMVRELERTTGEHVGIEKAEERSDERDRIVVASVQSLTRQNRLDRLGKKRFGLIVTDEAHHATANSYLRIYAWFDEAKMLGVTATPDRGDEKALGQVYDEVAYVMDIQQGIEAGYLVEVEAEEVPVEGLDISHVGTSGGDLAAGQLDEAMVKSVEAIVHQSVRIAPDRPGIWFWPGVKTAQYATEKFNLLQPGSTGFISGGTQPEERRQLIEDFKAGRLLRLSNCAVLTEGFDAPRAEVIGWARPTKSRSVLCQGVGRGTRPVVDLSMWKGRDEAHLRRALISGSEKPKCTILNFVGESGKHSLVGPEDALGGNYSEAEVAKAKKKKGGNVLKNLADARRELKRIAESVKVTGQASPTRRYDPFGVFHVKEPSDAAEIRFGYKPMTEGQRNTMLKMGLKESDLETMSRAKASKWLDAAFKRLDLNLASFKQLRLLQKHGVDDVNLPFSRAKEAIDYIAQNGWKVLDPARLNRILYEPREAGSDG